MISEIFPRRNYMYRYSNKKIELWKLCIYMYMVLFLIPLIMTMSNFLLQCWLPWKTHLSLKTSQNGTQLPLYCLTFRYLHCIILLPQPSQSKHQKRGWTWTLQRQQSIRNQQAVLGRTNFLCYKVKFTKIDMHIYEYLYKICIVST